MIQQRIPADTWAMVGRPVVFSDPECLQISAWIGHLPFGAWVMDATKPRSFVELGTHTGVSYFGMCQAAAALGLETACYAVDTWQGDDHAGTFGDEVFHAVEARNTRLYGNRSRLVRQTFNDARAYFSPGSVDLLHIDGFHSYDAVRNDFETWKDSLSDRGLVLFHDINVRERGFGVWKYWEEISQIYPHFSFLHSSGLGVLAVGRDQPDSIKWLTSLDADGRSLVRDFFQALGKRHEDALAGNHYRVALEEQSQKLFADGTALHREINALHATIQSLHAQTAAERTLTAESNRRYLEADFHLQQISSRLHAVHLSSSWRLTGPIRRITRLLRQALRQPRAVEVAFRAIDRLEQLENGRWHTTDRSAVFLLAAPPLVGVSGRAVLTIGVSHANRPLGLVLQIEQERSTRDVRLPPGDAAVVLQNCERIKALRLLVTAEDAEFVIGPVMLRPDATGRAERLLRTLASRRSWTAALRYWQRHGTKKTISRALRLLRDTKPDEAELYADWVEQYDTLTANDVSAITADIARLPSRPRISILMPVYNPRASDLQACLQSIQAQIYPDWELCIADDCSTNPEIPALLKAFANSDSRVKVTFREQNGNISAASNSALSLVTTEWTALVDHDDVLPPHALYMVAQSIARDENVDILYSDEDKIDGQGKRFGPYFKSDWNPELIVSQNMVSHLGVYRTDLLRSIDGFREGLEGSQDHDLILRASAKVQPERIRHLPFILYHWRLNDSAQTFSTTQLDRAITAAQRAVQDHLDALGTGGVCQRHPVLQFVQTQWPLPDPLPLVSVVIPTRDRLELVRGCVDGLLNDTDYPALDIIIMDNDSVEPATLAWFQHIAKDSRVRVVAFPGAFNFSAINNAGRREAKGELLLLLNNDIQIIKPDWLKDMVRYAAQPSIGAVGAKLLYIDDTIQHGGVVVGLGGVAGHAFHTLPNDEYGYFGKAMLPHDVSCVTAACLLTRPEVFDAVGGLDEAIAVAFNDVDFCLKIRKAGYRLVQAQHVVLYHLESASRGSDLSKSQIDRFKREVDLMQTRWAAVLPADPYYNPNLDLGTRDHALAFPPRVVKPWLMSGERQS